MGLQRGRQRGVDSEYATQNRRPRSRSSTRNLLFNARCWGSSTSGSSTGYAVPRKRPISIPLVPASPRPRPIATMLDLVLARRGRARRASRATQPTSKAAAATRIATAGSSPSSPGARDLSRASPRWVGCGGSVRPGRRSAVAGAGVSLAAQPASVGTRLGPRAATGSRARCGCRVQLRRRRRAAFGLQTPHGSLGQRTEAAVDGSRIVPEGAQPALIASTFSEAPGSR